MGILPFAFSMKDNSLLAVCAKSVKRSPECIFSGFQRERRRDKRWGSKWSRPQASWRVNFRSKEKVNVKNTCIWRRIVRLPNDRPNFAILPRLLAHDHNTKITSVCNFSFAQKRLNEMHSLDRLAHPWRKTNGWRGRISSSGSISWWHHQNSTLSTNQPTNLCERKVKMFPPSASTCRAFRAQMNQPFWLLSLTPAFIEETLLRQTNVKRQCTL